MLRRDFAPRDNQHQTWPAMETRYAGLFWTPFNYKRWDHKAGLGGATITNWWYTYPPEKWWSSSVGSILPNIWKNKTCSKSPTRSNPCGSCDVFWPFPHGFDWLCMWGKLFTTQTRNLSHLLRSSQLSWVRHLAPPGSFLSWMINVLNSSSSFNLSQNPFKRSFSRK